MEALAVANYMACYRDKSNAEALHFMREEGRRVKTWGPAVILSQGEWEEVRRAELKHGTLAEAATFGDRATIHALLSAGVAAGGVEGGCALIDAARHGHTQCVQDLLDAGAFSTGPDGAKAFGLATSAEVRQLLFCAGANLDDALAHAVFHGRRSASVALVTDLAVPVDPKGFMVSRSVEFAAQCGHGRLVRELIRKNALPPREDLMHFGLRVAAQRGRADDVAAFLQSPCPHDELRRVMRAAVANGHYAVMRTLCGSDARVAPSVAPGEDEEDLWWHGLCAAAEAGRSADVLEFLPRVPSGKRTEKLEEGLRAALSAGRVADFEVLRHCVANFRVDPELLQRGIWHAAFQDRLDDVEKLIGLNSEVSYGGQHVWRRVQRLRAQSPPELLTASVQSAALRTNGENFLPDFSDVSRYGFAARGITLLQLYMLCDQLRNEHFRSGSRVKFEHLTTEQMVQAYLKCLTSGQTQCGCPGCAMYDVADYADALPICPGPHQPHCSDIGPCNSYRCCAKSTTPGTEGYCVGCSGSGSSVADWIQGGRVPARYFAVHSWGQSFAEAVESFKHFAVAACSRHVGGQGLCPRCEGTSFWVHALAINQHVPLNAQIVGREKATERCIMATRGIALVLDPYLQPFRRVWCLYEILLAVLNNMPLDILTSGGCLTRNPGYDPEIIRRIRQGIETIDVSTAASFDPSDRDHILRTIRGARGIQEMEWAVQDRLLGCLVPATAAAEIVHAVREGSAERLREALKHRQGPDSLDIFDPETRKPLLQVAACRGHMACVDILVQAGANVQNAGSALMNAAVQHDSSARVLTLLDKRASLEACDDCIHRMARMHLGEQPSASANMDADERLLMIAGLANPIALGKVTLQSGADVLSVPVVRAALARLSGKPATLQVMDLESLRLTDTFLQVNNNLVVQRQSHKKGGIAFIGCERFVIMCSDCGVLLVPQAMHDLHEYSADLEPFSIDIAPPEEIERAERHLEESGKGVQEGACLHVKPDAVMFAEPTYLALPACGSATHILRSTGGGWEDVQEEYVRFEEGYAVVTLYHFCTLMAYKKHQPEDISPIGLEMRVVMKSEGTRCKVISLHEDCPWCEARHDRRLRNLFEDGYRKELGQGRDYATVPWNSILEFRMSSGAEDGERFTMDAYHGVHVTKELKVDGDLRFLVDTEPEPRRIWDLSEVRDLELPPGASESEVRFELPPNIVTSMSVTCNGHQFSRMKPPDVEALADYLRKYCQDKHFSGWQRDEDAKHPLFAARFEFNGIVNLDLPIRPIADAIGQIIEREVQARTPTDKKRPFGNLTVKLRPAPSSSASTHSPASSSRAPSRSSSSSHCSPTWSPADPSAYAPEGAWPVFFAVPAVPVTLQQVQQPSVAWGMSAAMGPQQHPLPQMMQVPMHQPQMERLQTQQPQTQQAQQQVQQSGLPLGISAAGAQQQQMPQVMQPPMKQPRLHESQMQQAQPQGQARAHQPPWRCAGCGHFRLDQGSCCGMPLEFVEASVDELQDAGQYSD